MEAVVGHGGSTQPKTLLEIDRRTDGQMDGLIAAKADAVQRGQILGITRM